MRILFVTTGSGARLVLRTIVSCMVFGDDDTEELASILYMVK